MTQPGAASSIDFPEAVRRGFAGYATFSGRSNRPEFWWWVLFTVLVSLAASVIGSSAGVGAGLEGVVALALLCPDLAVTVRRLHDTDRSGWWCLLILVPFIGWVTVLFLCAQQGSPGSNRHGPPSV